MIDRVKVWFIFTVWVVFRGYPSTLYEEAKHLETARNPRDYQNLHLHVYFPNVKTLQNENYLCLHLLVWPSVTDTLLNITSSNLRMLNVSL